MPTKQFYATGDFRYGTRMLRAGDPVRLDGPNARLFAALGKISPTKPRGNFKPVELPAEIEADPTPKPKRTRRAK